MEALLAYLGVKKKVKISNCGKAAPIGIEIAIGIGIEL